MSTPDQTDDIALDLPPPSAVGETPTETEDPRLAALRAKFPTLEALTSTLRRLCLDLEDRASAQINDVIEAAPFQRLEAAWRGVLMTVHEAAQTPLLKIKVLDTSWEELSHDLHYQSDIRRTQLFRLTGTRELNTLGGEPFGIIMIDHRVSMSLDAEFDDLFTVQLISDLGAAAMCPFVMGVADDFFGETDAAWATDTRRIGNILAGEDYAAWQRLRNWSNARFVGFVMPAMLLRSRYTDRDFGLRFHQWPHQSSGLWGTAAVGFLATVIAEYRRCAWFGFLKLVSDTPGQGAVLAPTTAPVPAGTSYAPLASIRLNRPTALFYSEQGFVPLAESTKTERLYFVGNRSVTECRRMPDKEVLSQLQSLLIACRLVHYLKVQMRQLIGTVKTASECELFLNNWLEVLVSNVGEAAQEILAKFPLKQAEVRVTDNDDAPGQYDCEILVKPQYQIDHMMGEIQLSTEFGPSSGSEAA